MCYGYYGIILHYWICSYIGYVINPALGRQIGGQHRHTSEAVSKTRANKDGNSGFCPFTCIWEGFRDCEELSSAEYTLYPNKLKVAGLFCHMAKLRHMYFKFFIF